MPVSEEEQAMALLSSAERSYSPGPNGASQPSVSVDGSEPGSPAGSLDGSALGSDEGSELGSLDGSDGVETVV